MIDQLFGILGINSNEAKAYLALAEMGKATASLLAKRVEMPRSTIYTILDSLLRRGMASLEKGGEVSYYVANQPEALGRMIEGERREKERTLQAKEGAATELLPLISPFFKRENYSIPKLQFYEGTANVESMLYDQCRKWQQSIAMYDFTWWGYQDHEFVETYRKWLDNYWGTMEKEEKIQLLSNQSSTEKKLRNRVARRVIKVLPKKYHFSSTVWVLGDYVVTIMTRQKPHYAFQLQDAVFAANQRLTFELLWGVLQ